MFRRTVSAIVIAILLVTTFTLAFKIQPVEASGTIYIRADGSVDPPAEPISTVDNFTYTFTNDIINESIVVERNNIVIDGNGYKLQGSGGRGIYFDERENVTIRNTKISKFSYGLSLWESTNVSIIGNSITENNGCCMEVTLCPGVTIVENNINGSTVGGITIATSMNAIIRGNNIANVRDFSGIVARCSNSTISENTLTNCHNGVSLNDCHDNTVSGNIIANCYDGIWLQSSTNNFFYHNDLINNTLQVYDQSWDYPEGYSPSFNTWDHGYTSGGNYWSNYAGKYPNAIEIEDSGIWNTPYAIDGNNSDNYPLMQPLGNISSTSVICSPNPVSVGSPTICTAFVSGSNSTGTITWGTSSSNGNFSQLACTLSNGSCSTRYSDTRSGTVTITATYLGDSNNLPSSGSAHLTVWGVGSIFQGDLVVSSGSNFTIINERLDVSGSIEIKSGGRLFLESATLNIIDYRVGWNWRRNHIDVHGGMDCINSTISTNRYTSIRGDGSVYVANSLLNKTLVNLQNQYSVLDIVSSRIWMVFSGGPTTIMNSTIEFVGGNGDVNISDSKIQTLDCVIGRARVQDSNISELSLAVCGDGMFNISDIRPGFLNSWDSLQNSNFSTNILNPPNVAILNSSVQNWSFWFYSETSGISVVLNNSDLHKLELPPMTSASPIDRPIGSLTANNSCIDLIYLGIMTYGPSTISLNGLSPGIFYSWNSLQTPFISMNWWNPSTREGCLLSNLTLANTRVESWYPYWGGGGGGPPNWSLYDCNLYGFWAQAQQADNISISDSLIGELTLDGWLPQNNPTKNSTISGCAIGSFFANTFSNTLASDSTIENLFAYWVSVTSLYNCSVTSLKVYDNATVNVVNSPSTIKEMFAYDSSKTLVLNSTVRELSAFGSSIVQEITYDPKSFGYTTGERNAAGSPSFQSDSASNVSRTFTFKVQSTNGTPQSGMSLDLYKSDGTLIQSTYTNLSGQASLKVTWGGQTQTIFGDCFTIRVQNETWQAVAQITPGSATFQTLVLAPPIAVTNFTSSKNVVGLGYDLQVNITVMNYHTYTETFNITVYANTTIIATLTSITLPGGDSTNITLTWNTTGFAYGNYTTSVYVWPVPGETYTADNTFIYGKITVTIPGDVDGNFLVSIFDVVKITSCYGKIGGDPLFNPNADIDGNGVINIFDIVLCSGHYGQKWP
jgi:parallel beta-helix repeat protein